MPGYQIQSMPLDHRSVLQFRVLCDDRPASVRDVFDALTQHDSFHDELTQACIASDFTAARFETPAATNGTLDDPFEFVLVDSPGLDREPDASPFSQQFADSDPDQSVIVFPNLRGDSTMIVPRPIHADSPYTHLLEFLRNAPVEQTRALWTQAGLSMLEQINDQPLWLSTAGGGVPWLHLRIDPRPKYYSYEPYKTR